MIAVEGIHKTYGSVEALRGISFEVEAGEVVGFLGPNGAGKTTTLRILTGYIPATNGRVAVDGFDVTKHSRAVRQRVGYLPEDVPLYRDMTVDAFLRYLAGLKDVPPRNVGMEVERVIDLTGLHPVRSRLVGRCSRGFRQRTGLAMALLGDPPVLLLDEPTSGLDPNQVVEVRDLIRDLSGEKTVLLSSHILSEVAQICRRVLIVHQGRLVASGTPDVLSGRYGPRRRLRVKVRGALEVAAMASVPGVDRAVPEGEGEAILHVADAEATAPAVARALLEKGIDLLELTPLDSDLEAVFRAVTRETGDA